MFHRYRHESAIYSSLSRIPLHVRMKLDVTGIKLSLKDWLAFKVDERAVLCHLPVETEEEKQVFSSYLDFLSRRTCGAPVTTTLAMETLALRVFLKIQRKRRIVIKRTITSGPALKVNGDIGVNMPAFSDASQCVWPMTFRIPSG